MPAKKPISLTVFGILLIACGLFLLYTFVLYLLNKPWTALVFDFGGILFFVSFFIFPPGLVVGFIVSGFGVLRAKPWARYLLLITTGFGLWGLVNRLILLGPCTEEFFYISRFFVGGLFLWFFNRKSVRPVFPYRKGLKVLTIVWIIVISLEFIGAGVFWFSQRKYYSYILNLQPAVYQSKDESFYSRDYFRSPFPLKYTLAIPNGFTPTLKKNDITGTEISLWSPKKGFISMGDPTFLQEMYSSGKVFGYGNPYRYFEKEYSERFGLFFMLLNVISRPMGVDRLEKVEIDGLRGFMYRGERKGKVLSHFFLFRGGEAMGHGSIALCGSMRQHLDDIISSLTPQDKPLKSAREFFQEGKTLFDHKDFEKAKFSFVSALCLDWENPQYHYYLGRAFFETEDWDEAKKHLEKAMSFHPDYPGAQQLLDQVKTKETDEKE